MEWVRVTNQKELDEQVAKGNGVIIDSSWVGSSHVVARDSSHVEARGSSHVVAWDSSHVVAWDSSHVEAWGSSHVEAWVSSHVEARVSSHVEARGSPHVEAWDFVTVNHRGQTVKLLSPHAVATETKYPATIIEWLELKGIKPQRKQALLWKATRPDGTDFRTGKLKYEIDKELIDPAWGENWTGECGAALHLSDSPSGARYFVPDEYKENFKLLQVKVKLDDCRVYGGQPDYPMKLRARACKPVKEVPMDYNEE